MREDGPSDTAPIWPAMSAERVRCGGRRRVAREALGADGSHRCVEDGSWPALQNRSRCSHVVWVEGRWWRILAKPVCRFQSARISERRKLVKGEQVEVAGSQFLSETRAPVVAVTQGPYADCPQGGPRPFQFMPVGRHQAQAHNNTRPAHPQVGTHSEELLAGDLIGAQRPRLLAAGGNGRRG